MMQPKQMSKMHNQDPLHGITLKEIVTQLVEEYGWPELSSRITIKCFSNDPSISSSLKFLRKTPWARQKVEQLYIVTDLSNKLENPYKKSTSG